MNNYSYNFFIALDALTQNKSRALLTSLGIVFGVASVIAMLAIGQGAQQEILEQMKLLGTNNIIIKPVVEQEEGEIGDNEKDTNEKKRFSPGLNLLDARSISEVVPHIETVNPETVVETIAIRSGLKRTTKLVGVNQAYFTTSNFQLAEGRYFSDEQVKNSTPVCVIGAGIKSKFFPKENPIGKRIKCGRLWMTVVGVLERREISEQNIQHLGIRDYNLDIYTPITTLLLRYQNRSLVTKDDIMRASRRWGDDDASATPNYHQLDRMVVQVAHTRFIQPVADIISRMLERRHNNVVDYEVVVPLVLLAQEQRTKTIFNIVLGAIASISLIVGGIGIMNIMLASVMERIKEIGIRRAVGAKRRDIILQFVSEAVVISLSGGIVGILLGIAMGSAIEAATGIRTIISPYAVIISFVVSISVGLVFGINPARKAAEQHPIEALRYE